MTTLSEQSSPFQNNTNNPTLETAKDFTFRTMQDDLLNLQTNNIVVEKNTTPASVPLEKKPVSKLPTTSPAITKKQKDDFKANPNPFLSQSELPTVRNEEVVIPKKTEPTEIKLTEVPVLDNEFPKSSNSAYKLLTIIVMFLVVGIVGLGGYYFWTTSKPKTMPVVEAPVVVEKPAPVEKPVVIETPIEKYSTTKPNYLTIDITKLSDSEIKSAVLAVANDSINISSTLPYEFIVVDNNNNPISFPIFATAAKINFSPAILKTLSDSFSLYIYKDAGNTRMGISAKISNETALKTEIQKQEKTLPKDLSFLFLDSKTEIMPGWVFKDGSYGDYKTRYLNLNIEGNISIDYTINKDAFIIGTSKNTLRAVIDSISKQQASLPQESANTTK